MGNVRDKVLDKLAEGIGDERDAQAAARSNENGYKQSALRRMRDKGIFVHQHAGVELARVPGEEVLRVRRTKQEATAENLPEGETEQTEDQVEEGLEADELEGSAATGAERRDAVEGVH